MTARKSLKLWTGIEGHDEGTLGAGAPGIGGVGAAVMLTLKEEIRLANGLVPVKEPRAVAVLTVTSARDQPPWTLSD